MNDRLNEVLKETEIACAKLKDGAHLCCEDVEELKGCLQSWEDAKEESYEEQKRREREEAERKAEEERKRKEEEKLRQKEELRRRQEEEDRLKREEEERQRQIEEERIRREEEVARQKEEERERLEAERREREMLKKEAEERAFRQDPNNWKPVTYNRGCDEVDSKRAFHGGINCVVISLPGGIEKDDLDCNYSDEVDSIINILENDEKPVSSVIDIQSKKGKLHSEVSDGAQSAVSRVKRYIEEMEGKIQELRDAQRILIEKNQDAIEKVFGNFKTAIAASIQLDVVSIEKRAKARKSALADIQFAHKQERISQDLLNDRLNELIKATEVACAKLKDGADLSCDDIEMLNGCVQSWKNAKAVSFEEEQRQSEEEETREKEETERSKSEEEERKRKEEEKRKKREREEEKRRKKEESERKKREEAERKRKDEEERMKREREETERKAEEERKRKEEEERLRQEELRRKKEEKERLKREEEERRRRLEEERICREEEYARKKEEERQRLEAERRKKERLKKEADERAFRQDPNNWKPFTYTRESDEVDDIRAYHGGVNCVMISPPGGIEEEDLDCNYSDEVDSIIEILENDEKPVSSVIDIKSKRGKLHSEVPSRIYIPHYPMLNAGDELVVKLSINGSEWLTISPEQTTSSLSEQEKMAKKMAGVEVNDFSSLKAIVVTRPRCQTIIVDKPGVSVFSSMDKNVKLFVPRDAFLSRTELKLMVQSVTGETLSRLVKEDPSLNNILSVKTMITLACVKRPEKTIEIDFLKLSEKQEKFQRGKFYQLYTSRDKMWKFADVEFKGNNDELTITLPGGRDRYTIMELEMPPSFPKENVPSIAETLYACVNATFVRMIVRQHKEDSKKCAFRIVRRELSNDTLEYLTEHGYTEGPGQCVDFTLKEGQQVKVNCTGNIENATETDRETKLSYLSYMGGTAMDMNLRVKDSWKQKDLPSYVGSVRCTVLRHLDSTEPLFARTIELTISLPKPVRPRTAIGVVRVKFPYYLTSLTFYLSEQLCKDDRQDWKAVLMTLLGNSEFNTRYRIARRKFVESDEEPVCRAMVLDWMKTKPVHEDKLSPIVSALKDNGNGDIGLSCIEFVRLQKEMLSDTALSDIAKDISKDIHTLGQTLGISSKKIQSCINQHPAMVTDQYKAVLAEWRESEDVVKHGDRALEYLKKMCV